MSLSQRARNAGCWAVGMYAFGLFFAVGALISFLNIDLMTTLHGGILAVLFVAGGIWLARRNRDSARR